METNKEENQIKNMFIYMKSKRHKTDNEDLKKMYDNAILLANKYEITGQIDALAKTLYKLKCITKEQEILNLGIDTYIETDIINEYVSMIKAKYNAFIRSSSTPIRPVKIIEMRRYEREIPDELVEVVKMTRNIFDEYYVLFTDYTDVHESKTKIEKDPILFGAFKPSKDDHIAVDQIKIYDRMYYLGDWEDEYCDLTLEKMINNFKAEGRYDIEQKIQNLKTMDELKEALNITVQKQREKQEARFKDIKSNEDNLFGGIFKKVTTFFNRK